ncbi:hypothetical protein KW807_01820 [Candidatus Parcubacteria bacterium]|nr:hypothetical protein [Candidatus Parcubacteria bacterium]
MKKLVGGGAVLFVLVLVFFYLPFVNYTHRYEAGLAWNRISGESWLQTQGGWHITSPWVAIARIDTRPRRVCITSAGRGYNCKLVQFVPEKYQEFLDVEGFHYYWWANRLSFNTGYSEEYRGLVDIFRGHAFGVRKYGFLKVVDDYATPQ